MKRFLLVFAMVLSILSSCSLEMMEKGESVNEYIFPYVEFTLSEDGTYYSASILPGASVRKVYIPAFVDDGKGGSLPVKYFTGFQRDGDEKNLSSTVFDSSMTEIKLTSLDQAAILQTLSYNSVAAGYSEWKNLPVLPHTEDAEFLGWFLKENPDVQVHNGDKIVSGYSAVYAKRGKHAPFTYVEAQEPTCTEKGWNAYHYCENCSYTTYAELAPLGHGLEYHAKADPTCGDVGYSQECWECIRCGLFFSDGDGTSQIAEGDVTIPATGRHANSGSYEKDASSHWFLCNVCGNVYDKASHSWSSWTLSDDKQSQTRKCTVCSYSETTPTEHVWEKVPAKEATCTEAGNKVYWKCASHSGEYSLDEKGSEIVNEETIQQETEIPATGHTLSGWTNDKSFHWKYCTVCREVQDKAEHTLEYTFDVDTEKRTMTVKRECPICGYQDEGGSSSNPSAFDISAAFGSISVTRVSGNSWTLLYTKEGAVDCYWSGDDGSTLLSGTDPVTVSYAGKGRVMVYCHELDGSGKEVDIAFVALTAY